ncbi:magnesium/cobalt transporter CorA [Nibribacter ruber]|uniref:Magnesium transport protein CorA n=1 Tax=Nibribacter ruber TaxID=2698458 RepID=A0A6P1NU91_9BACT|nr:magnesium/cobalt transporter CorA [Nibribacter ruber]QHL87307.1 magnesium/cobalt transporter CorA [Nibribacter ruber]
MTPPQNRQPGISILERKVGQKPGSLIISEKALPPRLFLVSFDEEYYQEQEFERYEDMFQAFIAKPLARHWIDVRGYRNLEMLEKFMVDFQIHPLQMEDVLNDYQRPKIEEDQQRLFIISRMLMFTPEHEVDDDQLSLFTGANYVLTFQSDYEDCLNPLRERIRVGKGSIRKKAPLYMAYAIMDVVLDHYFPAMAQLGEYAEELEDCLFENPSKELLSKILDLKREVVKIRRIIWPERDKINEILRMDETLLPHDLRIYFKDIYDHAVQLIDLVDNYRETTTSLTDLYLSNVSNRMNEVMKVLTIISTIFIPLSFIVGLYGMNFSRQQPDGDINPLNMPELYQPYGYVTLLGFMGLVVIGMVYYFYRKGWLS